MNASEFPSTAPGRMDRRTAIKWLLTAATSAAFLDRTGFAAEKHRGSLPSDATMSSGKGYGTDPDLLRDYKPGDLWPLTFNDHQRLTAAALCEVIIPADHQSPSAAALGVHDFIDEWISAPYPGYADEKEAIITGLAWIDADAQRRFGMSFVKLVAPQKVAICEDICSLKKAAPELKEGAQFFKRFRDLTAGGFYTTKEGMKDIGYRGNVPLATFDGPPPEVLKMLGLA